MIFINVGFFFLGGGELVYNKIQRDLEIYITQWTNWFKSPMHAINHACVKKIERKTSMFKNMTSGSILQLPLNFGTISKMIHSYQKRLLKYSSPQHLHICAKPDLIFLVYFSQNNLTATGIRQRQIKTPDVFC